MPPGLFGVVGVVGGKQGVAAQTIGRPDVREIAEVFVEDVAGNGGAIDAWLFPSTLRMASSLIFRSASADIFSII